MSAKTGRSRLFLNEDITSRERLAELRPRLLMHTSQHGQQRLLSPEQHVEILDAFLADAEVLPIQKAAGEALQSVLNRKAEVERRMARLAERREFLEFQLAEIRKVDPRPGEEEELLRLREASRHGEKIRGQASEALELVLSEGGLQEDLAVLSVFLAGLGADHEFSTYAEETGRFRDGLADMLRTCAPGLPSGRIF